MTARIEELVEQVMALPDSAARTAAVELVQSVMDLHAAALVRILELAPEATATLGADDIVSRVLVLHGLHPDDFNTRFARAIDKLEGYFDSRGSGIEVLEASAELARVRLIGQRPGSRTATRHMIEEVIYEAVPEVAELVVEGVEEHGPEFVPLATLLATT